MEPSVDQHYLEDSADKPRASPLRSEIRGVGTSTKKENNIEEDFYDNHGDDGKEYDEDQEDLEPELCVEDLGDDPVLEALNYVGSKLAEASSSGTVRITDLNKEVVKKCIPNIGDYLAEEVVNLGSRKSLKTARDADVFEIFPSVAKLVKNSPPPTFIRMDCPLIDKMLSGGFRLGTVNEITGKSASGKTQFCLHATVETLKKGGEVIYFETKNIFPSSRLEQILRERLRLTDENDVSEYMNKVHVYKLFSFEHAVDILGKDVEAKINSQKGSIKLLVLDSISGLFRGEDDSSYESTRSHIIYRVGTLLVEIAKSNQIAALVVNHVVDVFEPTGLSFNRDSVPGLGHTWTNHVTNRIFLKKTDLVVMKECTANGISADVTLRTMEVDFSSYLCHSMINFIVNSRGLQGIRVTA